jgi:hypothetical protein
MNKCLITSACIAATCSLSAQNVQNFVEYQLQQNWDINNNVELDAGNHTLDTNTTDPGLFQSIFGAISGNTIDRNTFKSRVSSAFMGGYGGVIDFEDVNRSFSGGDYDPPGPDTSVSRNNAANQMIAGNITISRGPNWWFEGSAVSPYKGKQTGAFDGTGPSGPDRTNHTDVFYFESNGSGDRAELSPAGDGSGRAMGLTTSYDLDFDLADQIEVIGFAYINHTGFQSQQDASKGYAFYPNIHAIATFADGLGSTETQMAVGLSSHQAGNDYYFGFEGSPGFYLQELDVYTIGNNDRAFGAIDDLGFVQVPEPSSAALITAFAVGLFALGRRRQ